MRDLQKVAEGLNQIGRWSRVIRKHVTQLSHFANEPGVGPEGESAFLPRTAPLSMETGEHVLVVQRSPRPSAVFELIDFPMFNRYEFRVTSLSEQDRIGGVFNQNACEVTRPEMLQHH